MMKMRGMMAAAIAAAAVSGLSEKVAAQSRWDLPSAGWPAARCVSVSNYLVFPCGNLDLFLTARVPMAGLVRCCSTLSFTTSDTVTVGADCKFTSCGAEWAVKVQASHTFSTSDVYDGASPCGCVQLYYEQQFRVRKQRTVYTHCPSTFYNPGAAPTTWTEERIIKDKVPEGGTPKPYYYQNPAGCPGCTNGRPNNPATPAPRLWDPNIPGGFPSQIPNARPQPETVPWDPNVHGPVNFDSAMATNGSDTQVTIDLQDAWKPREISSVLSLNLFECGWIIQSLEELRATPTNAGDMSRVEVLIADGVRLTGKLADVSAALLKYADAMVNATSYGDFNNDGNRDVSDVQLLQDQMLTGEETSVLRLYDVNGDGVVNQDDLTKWYELVGL
ncbi:MAG: dockerin type I repeat-containing protein [Phycisphaerales bacterium]|nr:dockerin type I repeat-containing protein [Phycisphaerales bacterium]